MLSEKLSFEAWRFLRLRTEKRTSSCREGSWGVIIYTTYQIV